MPAVDTENMFRKSIEDQQFDDINHSEKPLEMAEYENCQFNNCQLSGANLSELFFVDCVLENCDLSNAQLNGTSFKSVRFKNCKLLGLHFDDCNGFLLSFSFESCQLNFSTFYKLKLKNTQFLDCQLKDVDFIEADLTNAVFKRCDLQNAVFENTNLEFTDLRTAFNFSIDPAKNRVRKAKFSSQNIVGLLDAFDITIE